MPFNTPFDSTQLDYLRGTSSVNPTYAASEYVIFCPNTVIFAAQVSADPTGASYAQVSFDTVTVGAYTDIQVGQTVLISAFNDIRTASFTGRARKAPTSSILYINETSEPIFNNYYIWVIADFRLSDRLARLSANVQYKDYDIAFVLPPPLIYGLQSAYAGICSGSPEVLTLSFTPSALPIASGATVDNDTWLWTVPSGMTITVGTNTDQNITAEFDAGFVDWVTVQVDDSNGHTGYFHFFVGAVPSDLSSVVNLNCKGLSCGCDDGGWNGSIEAFTGVDDLLDNTLMVVFDVEFYNGDEISLVSNVKFVGRLRKEMDNTVSDPMYSQLKKASYDVEGALAQFSRVEHLPFTLVNKATPTIFDEVKDLTVWRAIAYTLYWHSTFLTLFSLQFDSTDTSYRYLGFPTQGGNILGVVQDLADSITAALESAPTGETRVVRNAVYLSSAQRAALPTILDATTQDYVNIDGMDVELVDTTGKVQASGGFFNSVSNKVVPLLSLAPGVAQSIGEGLANFTRQVLLSDVTQLVAQTDLNTRAGNEYAARRRPGVILNLTLPPGYHCLIPSLAQWYTFTLAATDTTGGRAYTEDTRWQLMSIQVQHDNDLGSKSVTATFKQETRGVTGQTVTYPPQTEIPPILPTVPTIPNFPSLPPLPDIILPPTPTADDAPPYYPPAIANGNTVFVVSNAASWTAGDLWLTNSPGWTEDTNDGDSYTITDEQWVGLGSKGKYRVKNNFLDTTIFSYTEDATVTNIIWIDTPVPGVYEKIRVGSTQGVVYLLGYGGACDDYSVTFDSMDDAPYTIIDGTIGANGRGGGNALDAAVITGDVVQARVRVDIDPGCTISDVSYWIYPDNTRPLADIGWEIAYFDSDNNLIRDAGNPDEQGVTMGVWQERTDTPPGGLSGIAYLTFLINWAGSAFGTDARIDDILITISGGGSFTGAPQTVYSSDFGATFGTARVVGGSAGDFVGFDTVKVGSVILAGADGQVYKATSGGAYAAYGDPVPADAIPSAIWIPRYKSNGAANSATTPDYILASSVLTASNEALWYVSGTGTVFTDITPTVGGDYGLAISPDCITASYKIYNHYSAVLLFDTEVHLLTSVNAGTAFTDRGQIDDDALMVRYRNGDISGNQLYVANGSAGIIVSPTHGTNLLTDKLVPTDDAIIALIPFG